MSLYRSLITFAVLVLTFVAGPMSAADEPSLYVPIQTFRPGDLLVLPGYIKPQCDILEQIGKFRDEMMSLELSIGARLHRYIEKRVGRIKIYNEPETQIALGLLNPDTCERRIITVTKRGSQIIAPSGYDIDVVTRLNGIQWNYWNTVYRINSPDGRFVAANVFPYKDPKTKKVTPVFYAPLTDGPSYPELVQAGLEYNDKMSDYINAYLRQHQVRSRAYPDLLVVNVPQLQSEYVERKLPIEHMDETEFIVDQRQTTDKVFALIGANGNDFAKHVCSVANACGARQFIASTWAEMVKKYPEAKLPRDYVTGARDPYFSAIAALLLDDSNLMEFRLALTDAQYQALIGDAKMLEEALASAYNTGATRTIKVLQAYFANPGKYADWMDAKGKAVKSNLLTQTKIYLQKLRYIRDEWQTKPLQLSTAPNR